MTFEPPRLLPDIPADREVLLLQRDPISRRVRAVIEHHDLLEANGCEVSRTSQPWVKKKGAAATEAPSPL